MNKMSKLRNSWIKNGLCAACGKNKAREGKTKCQECVDADVTYQRERRHKNRSLGLCVTCGGIATTKNNSVTKYCERCAEVRNTNARKNSKLLKIKIMSHYSKGEPKCACCGEKELDFLTIDHINNDGSEHRKTDALSKTCGGNIYRWINKNNFPSGFRVLCMNCNFAIGAFGSCPHQRLSCQS